MLQRNDRWGRRWQGEALEAFGGRLSNIDIGMKMVIQNVPVTTRVIRQKHIPAI